MSVLVEIGRCFCMLVPRTLPCCHPTTFCEGHSSPFTFLLLKPLPDILARFLCYLLVIICSLGVSTCHLGFLSLSQAVCSVRTPFFYQLGMPSRGTLTGLRAGSMQTSYSSARPSQTSCTWSWTIPSTNRFWAEPDLL